MIGNDPTVDQLQDRVAELESKLVQIQIIELRKDVDDHERRIRPIEDVAVKFNFIIFLTAGGGMVSTVNLAALIYLLVSVLGNP